MLIIFLTVFIDLLGFGIVLPLLPIYGEQFALQHGLTTAQAGWVVGLLMASFSAMQFIFLPVWGRLSDLYGRRPILLAGPGGFDRVLHIVRQWPRSGGSLAWLFVRGSVPGSPARRFRPLRRTLPTARRRRIARKAWR